MKSKQLIKEFLSYKQQMSFLGNAQFAEDGEVAILYGTDQFKINFMNKTIKLTGLRPIPFAGAVSSIKCDWIALIMCDGEWTATLGEGSPYSNEYINILPTKNGVIMAAPFLGID